MQKAAADSANPLLAFGRWLSDTPDDWPEEALKSAHRQFIDTIAVIVPGAGTEAARAIYQSVRDWGAGPSSVIGFGVGMAPPWAALVNGTAGHALDFDDNFDPAKAHASTVLVPAILALAEAEAKTGRAALDAYIAGLQIMGRVGQGVNPYHRNRGWHATATVGAIGAAAACARLLGLDAEKCAFALSAATSMASGFMSQFGTMTKPLHAGLAAKAGVMAATFARNGVTAGMKTLDGVTGMNRLMVGPDYEHLRDTLTHVEHGQNLRFETESVGAPLLITENGFRVKRFPNCGSVHRSLDGLLRLMEEHGFTADDVAAVDVWAPVSHLNNLMHLDPRNGLEAKFSLEYGVALVLLTGQCRLADFEDDVVMRPEVRALYPKIHRHPVDKAEGEFPTEVKVTLTDGRVVETAVPMPMGSIAAPFPTEQYWAKFHACVDGLVSAEQMADAEAALRNLPDIVSVDPLMQPLRGPLVQP